MRASTTCCLSSPTTSTTPASGYPTSTSTSPVTRLTHLCVVLVMGMGLALLSCVLCWSRGRVLPCSPVCCAGHGDGSCLAHLCVVLVMMLGLVTGAGLCFVSVSLDHRLLLVPLICVIYSSLFPFSVSGTGSSNFCWFGWFWILRGALIQ